MKYLQSAEKKEFVSGLVNRYMQIEYMKEEYQKNLLKHNKKSLIEQQDKLARTISKLVIKYKQDEDVECIHLEVNCDVCFENDHVYNLFIVCNGTDIEAIEEKFKKDKAKYSKNDNMDKLGGFLNIIGTPSYFYETASIGVKDVPECTEWTRDMIVARILLMSDILYDKTGRYSQMKDAANRPYNRKARVLSK